MSLETSRDTIGGDSAPSGTTSRSLSFLGTPVFETTDPHLAHDYLGAIYGEHGTKISGSEANFAFRAGTATLDDVAFGMFHHTMRYQADAQDGIVAPTIVEQMGPHTVRFTTPRLDTTMKFGQSMSLAHRVPYLVDWDSCDVQLVMLSPTMLSEVAAPRTSDRVELHLGLALTRASHQHWSQVTRMVRQVVAATTNLDDRPLLRDELVRTLCTAALACFPNSTLGAAPMDSSKLMPDAVNRAVSYIDEHPDRPIGLTDIAHAAGLSPRALQAAFRRHLDTTPLAYLRQVRMDYAHRDLQASRPGDGQSVATIAQRWGFAHLGRFASSHRDRYGVLPRQVMPPDDQRNVR